MEPTPLNRTNDQAARQPSRFGALRTLLATLCVSALAAVVSLPAYGDSERHGPGDGTGPKLLDPDNCGTKFNPDDENELALMGADVYHDHQLAVAAGCEARVGRDVKSPEVTLNLDGIKVVSGLENVEGASMNYWLLVDCSRGGASDSLNDRLTAQRCAGNDSNAKLLFKLSDDFAQSYCVRDSSGICTAIEVRGGEEAAADFLTALVPLINNDTDAGPDHDWTQWLNTDGADVEIMSETNKAPVKGVAVGPRALVESDGGVAIGGDAVVGWGPGVEDTRKIDYQLKFDEGSGKWGWERVVTGEQPPTAMNGVAIGNAAHVGNDRGVAIGAGANVTGNNGVAIGAGVNAGTNEIRIGGSEHTNVWIGNYNLTAFMAGGSGAGGTSLDTLQLQTNTEDIAANARAIAANADAISVNADGIAANAGAIDSVAADVANLNQQVAIVDRRVSQVAAIAAALNGLPSNVDADGTFSVGVGVGGHEGEMGMAVGIYGRIGGPDSKLTVKGGLANSGGETSTSAGLSWTF